MTVNTFSKTPSPYEYKKEPTTLPEPPLETPLPSDELIRQDDPGESTGSEDVTAGLRLGKGRRKRGQPTQDAEPEDRHLGRSPARSVFPSLPPASPGSRPTATPVLRLRGPCYLDCLQTGPFQHHNQPTASHLASRPKSGPLGRHNIPVLFLVPIATLTRLESTTGCSHLASRPEVMFVSLEPHALPNRKLPSGYHFKSRRWEMARAGCRALPRSPWEGRVSGRGGTSRCALPVRPVRVPPVGEGGRV